MGIPLSNGQWLTLHTPHLPLPISLFRLLWVCPCSPPGLGPQVKSQSARKTGVLAPGVPSQASWPPTQVPTWGLLASTTPPPAHIQQTLPVHLWAPACPLPATPLHSRSDPHCPTCSGQQLPGLFPRVQISLKSRPLTNHHSIQNLQYPPHTHSLEAGLLNIPWNPFLKENIMQEAGPRKIQSSG